MSSEITGLRWVFIQAIEVIKKGEEITVDYGFTYSNNYMYACKCGSPNCLGYMCTESERPKLKRLITMRKRQGKPMFDTYE